MFTEPKELINIVFANNLFSGPSNQKRTSIFEKGPSATKLKAYRTKTFVFFKLFFFFQYFCKDYQQKEFFWNFQIKMNQKKFCLNFFKFWFKKIIIYSLGELMNRFLRIFSRIVPEFNFLIFLYFHDLSITVWKNL